MLLWMVTGPSGGAGPDGKEWELPFTQEWWECMKLCLGTGGEPAGSSWVRVKGQTSVVTLGWVSATAYLMGKK